MSRSPARAAAIGLLGAATALLIARAAGRTAPLPARRRRLRVVVVGAGFGGLSVAEGLAGEPDVDLTVIDASNHHLFQPLLYQVATAALSPADIAAPLRAILPAAQGTTVLRAIVIGVDHMRKQVLCADGRQIPYDRLILATGSEPSYFGHDEWAKAAPGLKSLEDALRLRNLGLDALERAASAGDPGERARLLTFVLIGGGPTGVEMAGAIGEAMAERLVPIYGLPPRSARVILVEAGPRILAAFDPALSARATADLRRIGVEIRTGTRVTGIEPGVVHLGDAAIQAHTVIWTAGTTATPVARWLGVTPGHGDRVAVGPDLGVPGRAGVFVIGDAALARDAKGHPLPGLAPVAKQQGRHLAQALVAEHRGRPAPSAFRYRDYGMLATIGRNKAVAEFGSLKLTGRPAWLIWAGAHILFLITFRSRVIVGLEWTFAYLTRNRGAALVIPGEPGAPFRTENLG